MGKTCFFLGQKKHDQFGHAFFLPFSPFFASKCAQVWKFSLENVAFFSRILPIESWPRKGQLNNIGVPKSPVFPPFDRVLDRQASDVTWKMTLRLWKHAKRTSRTIFWGHMYMGGGGRVKIVPCVVFFHVPIWGRPCEQRHFYANKAKTGMHHLSETPQTRDARL